MNILEYNEFIEINNKLTENILLKFVDLTFNDKLFEAKEADFTTKMGNFFSTLEQGSRTGKTVADYLKNMKSRGIGNTIKDVKDSIQSFFRGGKGVFSNDDFERLINLFKEIMQNSNYDFKTNLKSQLEELDDLLRKYAKDNNVKYISDSDFKEYFRVDNSSSTTRKNKKVDRDSISN